MTADPPCTCRECVPREVWWYGAADCPGWSAETDDEKLKHQRAAHSDLYAGLWYKA